MKIAIALYSLDIGGSEILGRNLAFALKKQGHTPSVCAINHDGDLSRELHEGGISTIVVNRKPGEYFGAMLRTWKFFREFRPDVVHTHHLYVLIYCFLAAKLVGARLVHTEHEYFSLLSLKRKIQLRFLSIFCDGMTGVEDDVTAFLEHKVGINPKKLQTIRNGIDVDHFTGPSHLSRKDLGIYGNEPIIGIIARLEPVKDHATLLKAFAILQKKHPAHLLIIGDGSLRNNLEQECERLGITEYVKFTGPRRDIPDLLKLIDIFVLCSIEEGLPLSLLEAMAAAKPIVTTNVGCISKIVHNRQTGVLVPSNSPQELSHALLFLLENISVAQQLGISAQNEILKSYGGNEMFNAYIKIFSGN